MARILLAEVHDATRAAVRDALAGAGHEVVLALGAGTLQALWETTRPDAVVLGADLPEVEPLVRRLREIDPRLLLLVADKEHLGRARGLQEVLPLRPNAYVPDPTGSALPDRLALLLSQQAEARSRLRGAALLLARAPAAHGEVKPGVVARLLHQIWRALADGALVLAGDGPERRLYFQRGVPVAVESDDPAEALAGWMGQAGRLDAQALRAAGEFVAEGLTPGAALIAAGVLEPGEPLQAALRAHLRAMLLRSVAARQGRWRFHPGSEFAAQLQLAEVLPLPAILDGARAHLPVRHFADALKAVLNAHPARTAEFDRLLPQLGLGALDLHLARAVDGRTTTRALLETHKADLKAVFSLLWFLSLTGAVVFHDAPAPAAEEAAPRARPPLPADWAEAIRQAAMRILPGTFFQALGIDISADAEEVDRAFREVMARFDPAAFAAYEVGELADLLRSVQEKLAAAHRVLASPEKRRHYLSFLLLRAELSGARSPGIVPDAEVALRRGERALRRRRPAEALAALREAVERNPREPVYLAMLAFAALHDPSRPAAARAQMARELAREALRLDPTHLRALVVLALADELDGDRPAARAATEAALRAHPHSELARQVHQRLLAPAGA